MTSKKKNKSGSSKKQAVPNTRPVEKTAKDHKVTETAGEALKASPAEKKSVAGSRDEKITLVLSAILLVLTIAGIILFFMMPNPEPLIGEEHVISDVPGEPTEPEAEPEEPTEPEEPEVVYKKPEYRFTEEEVVVEIPGLDREYTIAWVSDIHMITDFTAGDVAAENLETVLTRYETLSVSSEGVHAKDLWPQIVDYLNYNDFDAVIFGGDLLDYYSTSNMDALRKEFERLKYDPDRILYIRADHDYGTWYSDGTTGVNDLASLTAHVELDGDDITHKYIDFGSFIIAGVNNSVKNPDEKQLNVLKDIYGRGVPVIAATHVPYYSTVDPSLGELSMLVRNRIYYWNPGDDTYNPNDQMREYLDLLYSEDTNCVQVLAGHLHAAWDGEINPGLRQHIFSPAFTGVIGVIRVVPAE